jgi:hypothetical protein
MQNLNTTRRKLLAPTVWADGRFPQLSPDYRYRNIFRVVLPLTDVLFIWFGAVGFVNGIGSVQMAAGDGYAAVWSLLIALAAVVALIGVSFLRDVPELAAKLFLIGLISSYLLIQVQRGFDDPLIAATAGVLVILILLPVWRVLDLGVRVYPGFRLWWSASRLRAALARLRKRATRKAPKA